MRFTIDTDTDTLTFADGLAFNIKFIHTFFKQPKGTIVEFMGQTEAGPVTLKTHEQGSTVAPPVDLAELMKSAAKS